jgi:putative restriction endonuclease
MTSESTVYVGVTDGSWYKFLAENRPDEVNFWQPGGKQAFRALKPCELFLFKLHSPLNYIAGGGFFVRHAFLPVSLAWDAFGWKNGTMDRFAFLQAIHKYRKNNPGTETDPTIGCIILTSPFFFERSDWIPVPPDWKPNIVQGKAYSAASFIGRSLVQQVEEKLKRNQYTYTYPETDEALEPGGNRYGSGQVIYPRLGQGAFRVLVTEAYHRRCAISGERTLPVLESAHIKPYAQQGPHIPNNGLLLRQDLHTLFDKGYLTISEDLHIEVSKRIREDFGNGREYYSFHGRKLLELPDNVQERPASKFIRWHNENKFLG